MAWARLLYESENGDRWSLVRAAEPDRVFIRHEPNMASGGRVADLEIAEFLIRGVYGPEHIALLRLIGSLVEVSPPATADDANGAGGRGE